MNLLEKIDEITNFTMPIEEQTLPGKGEKIWKSIENMLTPNRMIRSSLKHKLLKNRLKELDRPDIDPEKWAMVLASHLEKGNFLGKGITYKKVREILTKAVGGK